MILLWRHKVTERVGMPLGKYYRYPSHKEYSKMRAKMWFPNCDKSETSNV